MDSQRTTVITRPEGVNILTSHLGEFLNHFAAQESKRTSTRPALLSAEEYAEHCKHLWGVRFIKPKYSGETEINIGGVNAELGAVDRMAGNGRRSR